MDAKLPEEFAPTGPKLSRFPIRPAPPIRPHLFPDEAHFTLRLALLAGATEFLAWIWLSGHGHGPAALLALGALRCLKPLWARLGTRIPRPVVALSLLAGSVSSLAAWLVASWLQQGDVLTRSEIITGAVAIAAAGLPSLADLCASCIADSVTVERRAAAYAWLDMAQALGALLGLAIVPLLPGIFLLPLLALAIVLAGVGIPALRDRGTPRSTWPASAYAGVLRSPLLRSLGFLALVVGALAMNASHHAALPIWDGMPLVPESSLQAIPRWVQAVAPIAGMALAARLDRLAQNAVVLPRIAMVLAMFGWYFALWPLGWFALGMMFAAIPAAVARGAGEMERPLVSSMAWSALVLGAAVGAVL